MMVNVLCTRLYLSGHALGTCGDYGESQIEFLNIDEAQALFSPLPKQVVPTRFVFAFHGLFTSPVYV